MYLVLCRFRSCWYIVEACIVITSFSIYDIQGLLLERIMDLVPEGFSWKSVSFVVSIISCCHQGLSFFASGIYLTVTTVVLFQDVVRVGVICPRKKEAWLILLLVIVGDLFHYICTDIRLGKSVIRTNATVWLDLEPHKKIHTWHGGRSNGRTFISLPHWST